MSTYLLDTSIALIALSAPEKLTVPVKEALLQGESVLSVITYWEVILKWSKGNLRITNPYTWWPDALEELAAIPLQLRPSHIAELHSLPPIHQDPFDRVLMTQAITEDLTLLTTDRILPRHQSHRLRVMV